MTETSAPQRAVDIVVVTGMSGSGKSTAIHALEDQGYYCIDNLPTALVARFAELCAEARAGLPKVGLGLDLRDASYVARWKGVRGQLEEAGHHVFVIFLDASDDVLLRRFSETRRVHPLGEGRDLSGAIDIERQALQPLRETADLVIDTDALTVHDLKRRVHESGDGRLSVEAGPAVTVKSFGYKYGIVADADMVFDARFIPNPYYVEELRPQTGCDPQVAEFVLGREVTEEFLERILSLLEFLLAHFAEEGKAYLTIAVGCTGGRHRSVAIAEELAARLGREGLDVIVRHRDIERGGQ